MSKYQYELYDAIQTTLRNTVQRVANDAAGNLVVVINSENLVDALNRVLASIDGSLPQVGKKKGTVSTYELKNSSYQRLCEHYGVDAIEVQ